MALDNEDYVGSSLHTWGIRFSVRFSIQMLGIIPTYVGNTQTLIYQAANARDHPYIRGEYLNHRRFRVTDRGSSLHTWGIH